MPLPNLTDPLQSQEYPFDTPRVIAGEIPFQTTDGGEFFPRKVGPAVYLSPDGNEWVRPGKTPLPRVPIEEGHAAVLVDTARMDVLESRVDTLTRRVDELQREFTSFRDTVFEVLKAEPSLRSNLIRELRAGGVLVE